MVARTPPKQRKVVAPLNPVLLRDTLKKVDKCMERLQELQYTIAGGNKVLSGAGVSLSPRSTRGYLRTSLRCKQESLRIKNAATRKSPVGKFPAPSGGDWRRMSLPAMLLGETVGEILQASQFAREIVEAISTKHPKKQTLQQDPKTPETCQKILRPKPENTCNIKARRKKEKENKLQLIRSDSDSPSLQRVRSRIMLKIVSPTKIPDNENRNCNRYLANRVSPKRKPWAKKTVLFPNPLFLSTTSAQQAKFCRTRSPVIARTNNDKSPLRMNHNRQIPHKFLIKSPVKIRSPPMVSISPARRSHLNKKSSPKLSTASKLRRSFSPSRLASRMVSPLKSRKSIQKSNELMSGLKQRPVSVPKRFSTTRI